ncbi:MAG: YccF domain-containing protein [Micrococcaceae bacterium]
MKTILNLVWFVLSGLWMAIGYAIAGVVMCVTIIGIPFGIAAFRIAGYALWPFGRTTIPKHTSGFIADVGNIIWIILCGWWLALGHILTGIAMCITVVGIPLGIASFKMVPISLFPLGTQIVSVENKRQFNEFVAQR